jgi:GH25 family lysozyme M1 (1,4-beta-N-acetylmuramidase)
LIQDSEFIFVNTVSENKAGFTKRQIKEAEVNYPSWKDCKWIIRSNQIKDCPVTVDHVDTALKIWGKNVAALKGKTT